MALSPSRRGIKGRLSTNGKSREEVATKAMGAHTARATAVISGRISRHIPYLKGALLSISKATLNKMQGSIILRSTATRQTIRLYFVNSSRETPTATRATCVTMPMALTIFNLPVLRCLVTCPLTKFLTYTTDTKLNNKFLTHPCSPCRHPR
jgi:hypothetical protein